MRTKHVCLFLVLLIFVTGCAVARPAYLPTFPPDPQLNDEIRGVEAENGMKFVIIRLDDWLNIGQWITAIDRELKAACLALGNSAKDCHTEEASR